MLSQLGRDSPSEVSRLFARAPNSIRVPVHSICHVLATSQHIPYMAMGSLDFAHLQRSHGPGTAVHVFPSHSCSCRRFHCQANHQAHRLHGWFPLHRRGDPLLGRTTGWRLHPSMEERLCPLYLVDWVLHDSGLDHLGMARCKTSHGTSCHTPSGEVETNIARYPVNFSKVNASLRSPTPLHSSLA